MSTLVSTLEKQTFLDMFAAIDDQWNAGDRSAYLANYGADSVYMPPNQSTITGYEGIEKFVTEFPEVKLEHGLVDLWGHDNDATVHGTFKIRDMNDNLMDQGKFLAHYEKDHAGQWISTHAIWNSDLPVEES